MAARPVAVGPVVRRSVAALAGFGLVVGGMTAGAAIAAADGPPATDCANSWVCVTVGTPGSAGAGDDGGSGGGGGGQSNACTYQGQIMPCTVDGVGVLDEGDGCYYELADPQPPAGDLVWQGHQPGDGAIYIATCPLGPGSRDLWRAAAPPAPQQVDPAVVAQMAVSKLQLLPATLGTSPGGDQTALVGTPVWLWLVPDDNTYASEAKPLTVTASVPGMTVTAKVWSTGVQWNLGDGTSLTCDSPGTPYTVGLRVSSSSCEHTYSQPSLTANGGKAIEQSLVPGGAYALSALVTWTVGWTSSTGQAGHFAMDAQQSKPAYVIVEEAQVLNNQGGKSG